MLLVRVDDGGGSNIKNKGIYYLEPSNKLTLGFMKLNSLIKKTVVTTNQKIFSTQIVLVIFSELNYCLKFFTSDTISTLTLGLSSTCILIGYDAFFSHLGFDTKPPLLLGYLHLYLA